MEGRRGGSAWCGRLDELSAKMLSAGVFDLFLRLSVMTHVIDAAICLHVSKSTGGGAKHTKVPVRVCLDKPKIKK